MAVDLDGQYRYEQQLEATLIIAAILTYLEASRNERFKTRVTQITSAAQAGKLTINIAGLVFNCPIVNVHV
jgi:hypothetical protein